MYVVGSYWYQFHYYKNISTGYFYYDWLRTHIHMYVHVDPEGNVTEKEGHCLPDNYQLLPIHIAKCINQGNSQELFCNNLLSNHESIRLNLIPSG